MYPVPADDPARWAPTPAPAPRQGSSPVPDRSVFEIMWSVRRWLIVLGAAGFVLGVLLWMARPSVYEASAQVYVHRPPTSGNANPFRSQGATAGGAPAQEAVLKSNAVLLSVLAEPGIADGAVLSQEKDPVAYLEKKLRLSMADDKETMSLRFRSTDPQEAADVVNAVVKNFVKAQSRRANMTLAEALAVDTSDATETPSDQDSQPFALSVGSREMMTRLAEQQLNRLSEEVVNASLNLENATARLAAAERVKGDFDAMLQLAMDQKNDVQYDSSALTQIRQIEVALGVAQTRLSAAQQVLGPQHTIHRSYLANVQTLTQQLEAARVTAGANLLESFAQSRDQARARVQHLQQRAVAAQSAADRIAQLAIEVLSPAVPPRKPVAPKLVLYAGVGTMLGLSLATFLGLLGEVRRVADVQAEGLLAAEPEPWSFRPGAAGLLPGPEATGWDRPAPALAEAPPMLGAIPRIAATHRLVGPGYDRAADSVHQLRAVLQAIARQQGVKSVAFVSPRRRTGRTSVTIGVASSLATAGTRVLAIDADLAGRIARKHVAQAATRQHDPETDRPDANLMGIALQSGHFPEDEGYARRAREEEHTNGDHTTTPGPLGIAGFLDGHPLEDCLKPAGNDRLAFLPASTAEERHLGIFSDRKIVEIIEEAGPAFDLLLFDSGPIPGSLESFTVASVVDGVVIVIEENQDMAEYQRTLQHLRVINAKVLGIVVNKAEQPDLPASAGQPDDPRAAGRDDAQRPADQGPDFAAAGSGILAASIFTDREAGYQEQDWELTAVNDLLPDDLDDVKTVNPE